MASDVQVPPAAGVSPAAAAKELRTRLKSLYAKSKGLGSYGPAKSSRGKALEYRGTAQSYAMRTSETLNSLEEALKRRKPVEMREALRRVREAHRSEEQQLSYERKYMDRAYTAATGGVEDTNIERMYALVQVIPVIEKPTEGKSETALRAIAAIVKAHNGLIDGTLADVPIGEDFPLVLMHKVVEKVVEQVDLASPGTRWEIQGPSNVLSEGSIKYADKQGGFHHPEDGVGSNAGWNGGLCSYEAAVETLKAVRARYSDGEFRLYHVGTDGTRTLLATATSGSPIHYEEVLHGADSGGQEATAHPF